VRDRPASREVRVGTPSATTRDVVFVATLAGDGVGHAVLAVPRR